MKRRTSLRFTNAAAEGDGYYGAFGPKKRAIIHPLNRPLSTYTHFPLRFMTENRVPFGAVPNTLLLALGSALILTPGRCKKRISEVSPPPLNAGTAVTLLEELARTPALSEFSGGAEAAPAVVP